MSYRQVGDLSKILFIYLFRLFLLRLVKSATSHSRSRHSTYTVSEFHAKVPHATASEGLAQAPYVAVRAGLESTNEPPRPTCEMYFPLVTVFYLHTPLIHIPTRTYTPNKCFQTYSPRQDNPHVEKILT